MAMAAAHSMQTIALPDGRQLSLRTAPTEQTGTGGEVWQSAHALCRWLPSIELHGASVLELGCGTGIGGLFAAALGASRVLLTDDDKPALLELARGNIQINDHVLPGGVRIDVQALAWGAEAAPPDGPWDWVIGSDLTYSGRGTQLLCQTIHHLLSRDVGQQPTRVILGHQDRPVERGGDDGALAEVEAIAEAHGLDVTVVHTDPEPSTDLGYPVHMQILEITLRQHVDATPALGDDEDAIRLPTGELLRVRTAPFSQVGTGGALWQSGRALCRFLPTVEHELRGARVLELGTGTGIVGMCAAALGASHVLLTDDNKPALLDLARDNIARNVDLLPRGARVEVQTLVWGATPPPAGPWDWIVGSDVSHLATSSQQLCATILELLRRGGVQPARVLLAHQDRTVSGSLSEFVAIASASGLAVREVLIDRGTLDGYPPVPVAILELGLQQPAE